LAIVSAELTPGTLGKLVALYERGVFTQGTFSEVAPDAPRRLNQRADAARPCNASLS
jgi:hypothetical protein